MLDEVRRFIQREKMLEPGQPLWVAVSGGVDSMVLLHVLGRLGHPCRVAHVDHGLRGVESVADRAFVNAWCEKAGLECRTSQVDVKAQVAASGESTQMAARALRYAWFADLHKEVPMPFALAHHADDAVETLLINLMRGTGDGGWSGIRPVSGVFVRPLLCVGKEAILRYAAENDVPFREDSSNRDPKYLRNRVRHEVMPVLEKLRPGASRTMARSLELLREMETTAQQVSGQEVEGCTTHPDGTIELPFVRYEASKTPGLLLHRLLRHKGFHPNVLDRIREAMDERATGRAFAMGAWQAVVDRTSLIIAPSRAEFPSYVVDPGLPNSLTGPLRWDLSDALEVSVPQGMDEVLLDADRLSFPLELRPWREGDRMRPIGLGGSKLVSDILIDAKVPLSGKASTYVLISDGTIVWLLGHRLAEGFQASSRSARVLRAARTR